MIPTRKRTMRQISPRSLDGPKINSVLGQKPKKQILAIIGVENVTTYIEFLSSNFAWLHVKLLVRPARAPPQRIPQRRRRRAARAGRDGHNYLRHVHHEPGDFAPRHYASLMNASPACRPPQVSHRVRSSATFIMYSFVKPQTNRLSFLMRRHGSAFLAS